jgi:signal transduction histidine kinase/HAMP domain-containing protein
VRVSVSTKIFLSLAGVLIIFAAVAVYSIFTLQSIGGQLEVVDEGYIPLTKITAELEALESKAHLDLRELQGLKDSKGVQVVRRLYPASTAARVSRLLDSAEGIARSMRTRRLPSGELSFVEGLGRQIGRLREQHQQNLAGLSDLLRVLSAGRATEVAALRERLRGGERRMRDLLRALAADLEGRITATVLGVRREERTSAWAVMGLSVLAAAVGLLLVLYAQYTLRPIKQLTEGVVRIAGGDYSQRVQIPARDEIGLLASEFNRMAESLLWREERLGEQQREIQDAYRALQAEKRFSENIFQSLRSAVVVSDPSGRVTACNRAAREMLALEAGTDLLAAGALVRIPELGERLQRALGGEESDLEAVPLPDGRFLDLKLAPFREADGAVQGALLIADDVTERVHTKEQLVRSERLALVGRVAAQIAHEIRNPLSSIGLNADLLSDELSRLAEGRDGTEARALVKSIACEVDRLTELTEEYLSHARLPPPRLSREAVNQILTDLLDFMDGEFRARGIQVDRRLTEPLPAVEGDGNQLRQAFLNLLRNSCESMRGGGTLQVSTFPEDGAVCATIADTGVGIEPRNLPRIFDLFFSTKDGGTGLGLSLTHQIIEQHGGTIRCESEVGRGTTFIIRLPAAERGA